MNNQLITLVGMSIVWMLSTVLLDSSILPKEDRRDKTLDRFTFIDRYKSERPPNIVLLKFKSDDYQRIIKVYDNAKNVSDKRSSIWALAYSGNTNATRELCMFLTNKTDVSVREKDESVLWETVICLGILATKDDAAFEFLKKAANQDYWTNALWYKTESRFTTEAYLTDYSIHGIGISGRSESIKFLEALKARKLVNRSNDGRCCPHYDAVKSGAMYYWMATNNGIEYYRNHGYAEQEYIDRKAWNETSEGEKWESWVRAEFKKEFGIDFIKKQKQRMKEK